MLFAYLNHKGFDALYFADGIHPEDIPRPEIAALIRKFQGAERTK